MNKINLFLLISGFALILAACGGKNGESGGGSGDIFGSCDDQARATFTCADYKGLPDAAAGLESACDLGTGTYSTSACVTTDHCGYCTTELGDLISDLYYFQGAGVEGTLQTNCEVTGTWTDNMAVTCT